MQEPNVKTAFRHTDWDITFVVWAYRPVSKAEAANAVRRYLLKEQDKPLRRGSRIMVVTTLR